MDKMYEEEDKELIKMVGKNPITAKIKKDEEVDDKYEIFSYVKRLTEAACHCYTDDELSWDETLENLSKAILKLKGKEEELLAEEEVEEEDDEKEDDK